MGTTLVDGFPPGKNRRSSSRSIREQPHRPEDYTPRVSPPGPLNHSFPIVALLALETATDTCGVAVLTAGDVVAEAHLHRPHIHSARLTPLIEDVLSHTDVAPSDLDAVAVSMGPGSYTGLRIGVSTAKGWALACDANLVGVPTLEAYAAQHEPVVRPGDVVCALLDARRDEVYAGAYRWVDGELTQHAETKALTVNALPEWIGSVPERLWLLGNGGEKSRDVLSDAHTDCTIVPASLVSPSATWVGRRGRVRLRRRGPDQIDDFEPFYVKEVHATPAPSPFA